MSGLSTIPWEAIATLVTGMAAVAGAVIVATKQIGVQTRQNQILERQIRLEEARLNGELYERRSALYSATDAAIAQALGKEDADTRIAAYRTFALQNSASQFLVPPQIVAFLKQVEELINEKIIAEINAELNANGQSPFHTNVRNLDEVVGALVAAKEELPKTFSNTLRLWQADLDELASL